MQIRLATVMSALAIGAVSLVAAKINQAIQQRLKDERLKRDLERWDSDGCKPAPDTYPDRTQPPSG